MWLVHTCEKLWEAVREACDLFITVKQAFIEGADCSTRATLHTLVFFRLLHGVKKADRSHITKIKITRFWTWAWTFTWLHGSSHQFGCSPSALGQIIIWKCNRYQDNQNLSKCTILFQGARYGTGGNLSILIKILFIQSVHSSMDRQWYPRITFHFWFHIRKRKGIILLSDWVNRFWIFWYINKHR